MFPDFFSHISFIAITVPGSIEMMNCQAGAIRPSSLNFAAKKKFDIHVSVMMPEPAGLRPALARGVFG
jgi:hypothetical protein